MIPLVRTPTMGRVPASTRAAASARATRTGAPATFGSAVAPLRAPGLQLWLAPDSIVNGGLWLDKSPAGNHWTQTTANRQCSLASVVGSTGLQTGVQSGTARFISGPVGSQDCNFSSLYVLAAPIATGSSGARDLLAANAGAAWSYFETVGTGNITPELDYPTQGAAIQSQAAIYSGTPALISYVGNGAAREMFVNGLNTLNGQVGADGAMAAGLPVFSNNLFTTLTLGIDYTHSTDALATSNVFLEIVSCNVPHSPAVRRQIEAYFANKYGCQLVFDGNSQVKGDHASGQGSAITGKVASLLTGAFVMSVNAGMNGQTTPQLTSRFAASVAPLFNTAVSKQILCFWELENDVNNNGASSNPNDTSYAATAWSNLLAYSEQARKYAPGAKTCVLTCLPNGNALAPANYENLRLAVNTLVRNNWSATDPSTGLPYFDAIADVGATSTSIGIASATSGPLYDTDHQHMLDGGVAVAASIVQAAIGAWV